MVITFLALYLTIELKLPKDLAGYVIAAFGVGSLFGNYLGGWLSDRINFLYIQIGSLLISSFILIPLMFVKSYEWIMLIVFFFALVADTFRPANTVAIAHFAKPENQTRSYSLMRLAFNLGFTLGPAAGGVIAAYFGYKWLFLVDAITCALSGLVLWYFFRSHLKDNKPMVRNKDGKVELIGISAYKDKDYMVFIGMVVLYGFCFLQLITSIPVHFSEDLKYSESTVGLLLALNGLLVFVLEMPIIAKLESYKNYKKMMAIGSFLMIIAYLFLLGFSSILLFPILYITFITLSEIFAMPFMMSFAMNRPHPSRRGQYSALYSMAFAGSFIIAPSIGLFWLKIMAFILS
jgi:predicted MFS family arabinose efflux permease